MNPVKSFVPETMRHRDNDGVNIRLFTCNNNISKKGEVRGENDEKRDVARGWKKVRGGKEKRGREGEGILQEVESDGKLEIDQRETRGRKGGCARRTRLSMPWLRHRREK